MAQFVTHIQPTLVEASHHHVPHPHPHHHLEKHEKHDKHEKHEKHHKEVEHHQQTSKEHHHGKDKYGWIHLPKIGHSPQHYPVLPATPSHHHGDEHSDQEHKRDSGQYLDSHGIPHTYQLHFIDSQGIHRDFHGHAEEYLDQEHHEKEAFHDIERHWEKMESYTEKEEVFIRKAVPEERSPFEKSPSKEEKRPVPPQYINLHQIHTVENKYQTSDGNTSFLRAARNGQLDKVLEHLKSNIDINASNSNGLNALHLASKDGHLEIVKELLKRGALVDSATKKGNTALHIASLAGQEEVVKLLVQNGASVNVQSQNGFTPLYMAAQENHDNVVRYLLANGANQSLSTEDGFTPLAVAMQQGHDKVVTVLLENDTRGKVRLPALHIAAKKDDVKAAKLLLENEHNPDVTSKSGFTPLHIASHYGNQQIANLLIEKGADVNYAAKHNITPLHVAAKWGKANMVAILLENGATIDAKTRDGLTPLHCAARSGHEQVVDMLLEKGAPISSKTKNGLAPLHMAAQGDHVDAARILLYHRAPVDEVTVDYLTALHVAAHCGHVRVAKLLLDRQADANARALNGFTPLHIACKKNRIKVVELLLKHGASIGATTESGLTPLHVASFMGCMNIVIYLLQHDANPDAPTIRGETPLHLAARANQTDIIRILLRNGAQVDARAREQQTPLHIASRLGNVDIAMLLLQHGAKVDNATKDMYTALHIAAKEGQEEVAVILIDNGAAINATTKKGFTPLHLASKYGNLKVAKLLLQKEAPVDAQGKNGVTPLHVASHYDHQYVALLLLDKGASPHATAKNGHTPLHIAARKNQMDIANTLLEYGTQPNAESKAGFTPLHLSAQEGHVDMSSLLLEHKADPNHEAKNGLAPLHLCAQEDRVPVAEVLVRNGAHVNAATKAGYTPLHIACHYGQTNMVKFLLKNKAEVQSSTSLGYTPLHQAAQQGHTNIVNILLENKADPDALTTNGQTPLNIAQKLGYITVIETLKLVTTITNITTTTTTNIEEKYKVQAPEAMQETFMSDSEEEGGEDTALGDQTYRYLTADEMKSLGDDSLPIDVTRDERIDSNKMSIDHNMLPPQHIEDSFSPEHASSNYTEYIIKKYTPDNIDINRHPIHIGFLVSFLVDARGGAMRGCRHSGVRVIVPPRSAGSPTRITCRYVRPQRTPHPPPLMEGEALASRVLELGPVGAKFLGPVVIEVPHFAALRGKEREIVILRSDNGEAWKEHTVDAAEDILNEVLHESFEAEDLNQMEDVASGRITRIVTQDFPQYFAVVSRVRQEVHAIGPEGGMVSSTVVPQVQAIFPEGALTKKIKVGLQAQPIDPELTAKLLGHGVAVSPVVTVEPRRRKFHKAIRLNMPAPTAHSQGMINQYSGSAPTLRLLCSITGGTTRAQWEDVTGSTPLTFVNDVVSFTTTVSARFWLMDCRNIGDATKMATELYKEAIHVPFMAKFVVFAKRIDPMEARLRVFCMTDDKEDKTLEHQEHFTEVAKSRDVEVLEGKCQFIEFAGNLVPITKSGEHLQFSFRAFRENRLPFSVRVKDQHAEAVGRCLFMREPKIPKGEQPQQPICILNIVLPDDIVTDTISLTDSESGKRHMYLSEFQDYYKPDPRLADMSNLLGEDWVELAHQLGLTSSEINVIKSEYPESIAKQAQSMLRMWLSQSGNKAQTNTLENALKRIGREDIIPQCLNVEQPSFARIKEEEIGYRLRRKEEEERRKIIDHYDKYSAEEKAVKSESEEEDNFDRTVTERREQIEKRLSAERAIPASAQRREIVQEISDIKRQSLVEDKIAEVMQKGDTDVKIPAQPQYISETIEIKTTLPSDSRVTGNLPPTVVETHKIVEETATQIRSGEDARFVEEVSSRFDGPRVKIEQRVSSTEDPRSPNFSKTPPPSPADFLLQKQAAAAQEWDASRRATESTSQASISKDAAQQETSCGLIPAEPPSLTTTDSSAPQPKPRTTKPDMPLDFSKSQPPKPEKILSPVRDDLLDNDEDEFASYSDRKKFWENVTKETAHKRMSLHEVSLADKSVIAKKRTSVHEIVQPPVPKPRATLQTSLEVESVDSETKEKSSDKILSEYQASFIPPLDRKTLDKPQYSVDSQPEKDDSLDSDRAQKGSSQFIEHTGYISDSEDVENVISDSEIEDRVPQIRERQMSVFAPPVTQRKSIYERSASLPTEDLYEVSRNLKQLKEKYEQKIKEDLIEEQFVTDNEEGSSPERKTLAAMQEERMCALKTFVDQAMSKMVSDDEGSPSSSEDHSFTPIKSDHGEKKSCIESGDLLRAAEIHLDKSETERSEKSHEEIPEITVTLSGKQRRISEESDSSIDRLELTSTDSELPESSDQPIKQPKEYIQDTLWEATVETPANLEEKVGILEDVAIRATTERTIEENVMMGSEEEDEIEQLDHIVKRNSIPDPETLASIDSEQQQIAGIKENISEKLTKELHEKLSEKLKARDIVIEKAVSEEVDDKTLDELKELMLEEALEELHQQKTAPDREEDLSSGLKDESDLASEVHMDQSESAASERIKSESHSEIEKIILDTFQHMKVDPDEAKRIASQLIQEIETELQNRGELSRSEASEQMFDPEMSSYLKHLAETNGLDEREVELVESVLARRQRELAKLARGDTQASSMEITDEDLRFSGAELADYTNTLEQQMDQLEAEKIHNLDLGYDLRDQEFHDKSESSEKIDEHHKSEKRFSQDSESYDDFCKANITKKETATFIAESIKGERSCAEHKNVILEEDETVSESSAEEHAKIKSRIDVSVSQLALSKSNNIETAEITSGVIAADIGYKSDSEKTFTEIKGETMEKELSKVKAEAEEYSQISGKSSSNRSSKEITEDLLKEIECSADTWHDEQTHKEEMKLREDLRESETLEDGTQITTKVTVDKQHFTSKSYVITKDKSNEKIVTTSSKTIEDSELAAKLLKDDVDTVVTKIETVHRTSSSDSKSSVESGKSPDRKLETQVILRRGKADVDSSSSSSILKPDRRSGVEAEAYSSSGESHYQSFEMDSGRSRPCSSDVEGIVAAASSEYETAMTSTQEYSAKSHLTSTEYHTAISSLSSKESMKSLDSESSGHLGSIEVSERSETLVPSTSDIEGDILDSIDQQLLLDDADQISDWTRHGRQISDLTDSDVVNESIDISEEDHHDLDAKADGSFKMKRSAEMTFQPELKGFAQDSPHLEHIDIVERYGQSLDEGSVLSMSASSTTSSTGAQRTVIEMHEGSLTGVSEHLSLEDNEMTMRGSQESLPLTPTLQKSYDISTSTPQLHSDLSIDNVTLTTSSVKEDGMHSASTQITSETFEGATLFSKNTEEPKKKGHRRTESTMIGISLPPRTSDLKVKEKEEIELEKDIDENELTDKERPSSSSFSDKAESEIGDAMKSPDFTGSFPTEPFDRPKSPEPQDDKLVDLEEEFSQKTKEVAMELQRKRSSSSTTDISKDILEKRDSHGKSSTTSSEKSSFEEAEAEAAFNMVAHISPAHKVKQIIPILEDEDAEKRELELREKQRLELEKKKAEMRDISPGFIPNITVTDTTPESEHASDEEGLVKVSYETADVEEGLEKINEDAAEDRIEDDILTSSMMQSALIDSVITDSMTTSDMATVVEGHKSAENDADSHSSDSFEMLEKPDIIDDFVVIEEVGKEAQEFDTEGQSVKIDKSSKKIKKHDEEIEKYLAHSAPTPLTGNAGASMDDLGFEFEDSPPRPEGSGVASTREYGYEYDRELEANKQWIEKQFQGDQAAMIAAGYGYEMEFERGPLEDIKEEDINDFAASSYGSQKESGGSLGSVKDSYSSTPDYDVLAGRKYFTRSGDQDDISMNSLQEFEKLEQAMSLEMRKFHQGQGSDSSSSGSSKNRFHHGKNNTGDDISVNSLKEFEGLEHACIQAHKIEVKAKEEEAALIQIDEGQESIASESESCETVGTEKKITDIDEEEDYEKRMFEIDAIIKQAQSNVERFIDLKEVEKTESLGRGDSIEEVSKVPELDLDGPVVSTIKVQWKEGDDVMVTSTDSLDLNKEEEQRRDSADSLDAPVPVGDLMTASTDSIEFQAQKHSSDNIMSDSIEIREEKRDMVSSDSLELGQATSSGLNIIQTDSIDEDASRIGHDHSSASTGKDFSSSAREEIEHDIARDDLTSSTATHATMQYDTDSVFSGSFTSGGSNTMVSSTDTIDPKEMVDVGAAARKVWFDEDFSGRRVTEYVEESSRPYVSEHLEPLDDPLYSHVVHRKVELPPEVRRVTFTGPDADEQLRKFMQEFDEGGEVQESQEVDEFGNVHTKKVVQKRFVIKGDQEGQSIEDYFRDLNRPEVVQDRGVITRATAEAVITQEISDGKETTRTTITKKFELPGSESALLASCAGEEPAQATAARPATSSFKAESEEVAEKFEKDKQKKVSDQHQLSDEMKELLKEMERESKQ